jgi:NDP-sugar pyrophosphorylase family protein
MKAMILAAGLGTRLRPLTNTKPKALVDIEGHTMLELAIRYLKKHGVHDIVINVHHFPEQIVRYLNDNKAFGVNYSISDETDQLMDTGGALVKASDLLGGSESFIVMGVDVLTTLNLADMMRYHQENDALVTLAVKNRPTSRSLLFDDRLRMIGWQDNSSGQTKGEHASLAKHALGFSVVQIVDPKIFSLITETGAFSLIDLYLRLMKTERIMGYRHDDSIWLELGRADKIKAITQSNEFHSFIESL